MKTVLSLACLLGLFASALVQAAEEKPKKANQQIAKTIDSVTIEFTKGDKPEFVVTASTTVPTGGYKAELRPSKQIMQPKDGIAEYELYLTKPDGIVIQVISEVSASHRLPAESAAWIKGVRVLGQGDGIVVKMIEKK